MDKRPFEVIAVAIAIFVGIFLTVIVLGSFLYRRIKYRTNAAENEKEVKSIRHRPSPLTFDKVRVKRIPTQLTHQPLVITPSTPNHFTIPSRPYPEGLGRSISHVSSPDGALSVSPSSPRPSMDHKATQKEPPLQLSRTMYEPHGKIECFLRHDGETNSLAVQVSGKGRTSNRSGYIYGTFVGLVRVV